MVYLYYNQGGCCGGHGDATHSRAATRLMKQYVILTGELFQNVSGFSLAFDVCGKIRCCCAASEFDPTARKTGALLVAVNWLV